jgi:hypothetical protein
VDFAAITLCVASQRAFIVTIVVAVVVVLLLLLLLLLLFISLSTQSGNFWIHPLIWSRDSSVGIATRLRAGRSVFKGSIPVEGWEFFSSPPCQERL